MKLLKYSLAIIFLAISVYLLVFRPFRVVMVIGESMTPTLHPYQLVVAYKTSNFKKGDVVIIDSIETETIIKRIKYVPGDKYSYYIDYSGMLLLPDNKKDLYNFLQNHHNTKRVMNFEIQKDYYFVLGDNLDKSDDSRRFGPISKSYIKYKVIM
jgi:signal peptidase I